MLDAIFLIERRRFSKCMLCCSPSEAVAFVRGLLGPFAERPSITVNVLLAFGEGFRKIFGCDGLEPWSASSRIFVEVRKF